MQAEGSGEAVQDELAGGVSAGATRDPEMPPRFCGARRPNQRVERARAHRCTWRVVVPALALLVSTPLAWAATDAQDVEESVPDPVTVFPDGHQLEMIVRDRYP